MGSLLEWLAGLPEPLLYGAIALAAFAENIFPPLPADTVVALGAFVAARGNGTAFGSWAATMVGNLGGAMAMYWVGRRFGLPWLSRRIPALGSPESAKRFEAHYKRYGIAGLAVSRFLPGVRAVVPPMAGALGIGPWKAFLAMGIASGAWYAIVCWLAFRAGANAEALLARIAEQQRTVGIVAAIIVLLVVGIVLWKRRAARKA
jgi:membrane protein DedA with SNARE-associated domain